jgi:hypothetical protein
MMRAMLTSKCTFNLESLLICRKAEDRTVAFLSRPKANDVPIPRTESTYAKPTNTAKTRAKVKRIIRPADERLTKNTPDSTVPLSAPSELVAYCRNLGVDRKHYLAKGGMLDGDKISEERVEYVKNLIKLCYRHDCRWIRNTQGRGGKALTLNFDWFATKLNCPETNLWFRRYTNSNKHKGPSLSSMITAALESLHVVTLDGRVEDRRSLASMLRDPIIGTEVKKRIYQLST